MGVEEGLLGIVGAGTTTRSPEPVLLEELPEPEDGRLGEVPLIDERKLLLSRSLERN